MLTRSDLTYPEVSSNVYHNSFCQLGSSISLPWLIYFEARETYQWLKFNLNVLRAQSRVSPVVRLLQVFLKLKLLKKNMFCITGNKRNELYRVGQK